MIRLFSIGAAATLTIAGMLAPASRSAEATEALTLGYENIGRVMKKPGATKVMSGRPKAARGTGKKGALVGSQGYWSKAMVSVSLATLSLAFSAPA